jgi:hypothetical protein
MESLEAQLNSWIARYRGLARRNYIFAYILGRNNSIERRSRHRRNNGAINVIQNCSKGSSLKLSTTACPRSAAVRNFGMSNISR